MKNFEIGDKLHLDLKNFKIEIKKSYNSEFDGLNYVDLKINKKLITVPSRFLDIWLLLEKFK